MRAIPTTMDDASRQEYESETLKELAELKANNWHDPSFIPIVPNGLISIGKALLKRSYLRFKVIYLRRKLAKKIRIMRRRGIPCDYFVKVLELFG